ncbi:MAG: hypothetical protein V5A31_02620 [Haloferacaceae archaeon]|jgi:hypothetical protein
MANEFEALRSVESRAPATTWLDTVDELLDATIDANETVECAFDEFAVDVPLRIAEDAPQARWRLDGTVRVSVEGTRGPLAEWLRWWAGRTEE